MENVETNLIRQTKNTRILPFLVDSASWIALIVLLLVCVCIRPEFRDAQTLLMIARQVTVVGIIALGMTFVIAGGGIDLSVGSLFALSG
ncbi:MAG: ribose ABC transporter permease, partial [Lentisphaeria bacterium]|nr:ribose ABC transporter permease [Lentisphaeria bacterium]